MPVPFNGRVEVISSKSILLIYGLQYNDSNHQFSSAVNIVFQPVVGPTLSRFKLRPIVALTVSW